MKSLLKKFKFIGAFIGPFLFMHLAFAQFEENYGIMKTLEREMSKMMESAKECVPRKDQLCTGVKFTEAKLIELYKADLKTCKAAIEKRKYKFLSEKEIGNKYPEFTNSTKRAYTLYDEKLVLYKNDEFNRIDCLHELLHLYQHDPGSNWDLAPATRKYVENKFLVHLNKAVTDVENAEKAGDLKSAKNMNQRLQPLIKFIEQWMSLGDWLDEKDVHYFIYIQCAEFKCTDIDSDIALSNLFKLIDYFPAEVAARIRTDAAKLLAQKEEKARLHVTKTWKETSFHTNEISKWLQMSWDELLKMINEKNIKLARVNSAARFKGLQDYIIPEVVLNSLPVIQLQDGKLQRGEAFAKFIPAGEGSTIVLTQISTRTSLVHEYLHYLQYKVNADYARALLEGPRLMPLFMSGKLSRQKYEESTMISNALFAMAEYEVYKTLVEMKDFISPLEHQNNLELLAFYKKKLGR